MAGREEDTATRQQNGKQTKHKKSTVPGIGLSTQVSEDLRVLYRNTTVAKALAEALGELTETMHIPDQVMAGTMEAFDKAVLTATENVRNLGSRAKGQAELDAYNNVEERWTLFLKQDGADLTMEESALRLDDSDEEDEGGALEARCCIRTVDTQKVVKRTTATARRKID